MAFPEVPGDGIETQSYSLLDAARSGERRRATESAWHKVEALLPS